MRVFGMLRIRNEAHWIGEVLDAIQPLCEWTYILDDKSTDNTVEVCQKFPRTTVYRNQFEGLDEARDKTWLLNLILDHGKVCETDGDWILAIDGDEILEPAGPDKIRELLARDYQFMKENPSAAKRWVYALKVEYLWNSRDLVRTDGVYGRFYRPSLFKLVNPAYKYKSTPWGKGGNLHCSNIPQELLHHGINTDIRLLHLGYITPERRLAKYEYYNRIDPENDGEGRYMHVCQGDHPQIPADATLKWAGPLEVRPLAHVLAQ